MDKSVYAVEAEVEASHWWFVGRRGLFDREIKRLSLEREARVLDVGTSTGTNLRLLRDAGFTNFTGLDMSEEARRYCAEKGLGEVEIGDVRDMPFPDRRFDLVLATDIVEHVDDDERALSELARVTTAGGHVLITVPAFHSLWGFQDDVSYHKRRYRRAEINAKINAAGLVPVRSFYFNTLLFVPIWLARRCFAVIRPKMNSENQFNTLLLNRILTEIFKLDCRLAPILRSPFGVSILTLARRPEGGGAQDLATNTHRL